MPDMIAWKRCAAQHFGMWMVDSIRFAELVAAVKDGSLQPMSAEELRESEEQEPFSVTAEGIAVIPI